MLEQPVSAVGHLNVGARMKNWKLDVRFSSALSQRGPPSLAKVEKRDDASS